MEKEPGEELRSQLGSDIVIDDGNVNEFFFMDSDAENEKYGVTTKSSLALTGSALKKHVQNDRVSFSVFSNSY